ncbi:PH domain-containing protein [Specibacter sp. NPDC057265]|uniref:PH domain-containing protein n=1 Tax=Specibacter sp. NPDC057265 TaxID=3346075 RepID=UPI00362EAC04
MHKWLLDGEQVEIKCRPHARVLIWPITVGLFIILWGSAGLAKLQPAPFDDWAAGAEPLRGPAIVLLLAVVAFLLVLYPLRRVLRWNSTRYVLTSRRLLVRRGLLQRSMESYFLEQLQEIRTVQSWRQRLVGSGDLQLFLLAGSVRTVPEVPFLRSFNSEAQQAWSLAARFPVQQTPRLGDYAGGENMSEKELRELGRNN